MDTVWNALNAKLKLPITPKVHTVTAHYIDYIRLTKQTLGETNDQAIESAHQEVKNRMKDSNYKVKNKESKARGRKLLQTVLHTANYNAIM